MNNTHTEIGQEEQDLKDLMTHTLLGADIRCGASNSPIDLITTNGPEDGPLWLIQLEEITAAVYADHESEALDLLADDLLEEKYDHYFVNPWADVEILADVEKEMAEAYPDHPTFSESGWGDFFSWLWEEADNDYANDYTNKVEVDTVAIGNWSKRIRSEHLHVYRA